MKTNTNGDKLTHEEMELYYVVSGNGGSFKTSLFETIMRADVTNKAKLYLAFPRFVDVVIKYQNVEGYWESILERLGK